MKKASLSVLLTFAIIRVVAWSQDNSNSIYKNPNAAIPERMSDLLGRMTVEEQVAQLESGWRLPAFGTFQIPSPIEGDHVNEAMAKKIAGNGLGTYAFLDEFSILNAGIQRVVEPRQVEIMVGAGSAEISSALLNIAE